MSNRGADFLLKNRAAFPRLNGELCREPREMPPDGLLFIDSCGAIKAFDRKFELLAGAPVTPQKVTALFPAGCTPFDLLETCERHQEVRHARVTPPERPGVPARIEYIGVAGGLLTVIRLDGEHEIDDAFDDVAGSAIAILDPQGSLVRFNRGAQELMSLFEEEVLGRPFWDVLPAEEEKSSVRAAFEDLLAGADMPVFENRSKTRGGSVRTLLWSSAITRNATGHIQYVVCTGIDVTLMRGAMRDTETALDELSREFLEAQSAGRKNVSQYLHDTVSQQLVVLSFSLGKLRHATEAISSPDWGETFEVVDRCCRDLRVISYALAPPVFEDTGLNAAFDWYSGHLREDAGIDVEFHCGTVQEHFAPGVREVLFAALQEWAGRAIRSPGPVRTVISLNSDEDGLELAFICDDPENAAVAAVCGSPVIRERVRALGGFASTGPEEAGLSARIRFPGNRL